MGPRARRPLTRILQLLAGARRSDDLCSRWTSRFAVECEDAHESAFLGQDDERGVGEIIGRWNSETDESQAPHGSLASLLSA